MTNIPLYIHLYTHIYVCIYIYVQDSLLNVYSPVCWELEGRRGREVVKGREKKKEERGIEKKKEDMKGGKRKERSYWLDFIRSLFIAGNSGHCIIMRGSAPWPCEGPGRMPGAPLVLTLGEKDSQWRARIPGLCKCVHHLDSLSNTAHMTSMTLPWCL